MTLDAVAALLDAGFAPSQTTVGKHSGIKKNLAAMAQEHNVTIPADIDESVEFLTDAIKEFRDDYVVHRAVKNPSATRGLVLDSVEPTVNVSIAQIKREGPLGFFTTDPAELHGKILEYVDQVLDLILERRRCPDPRSEPTWPTSVW